MSDRKHSSTAPRRYRLADRLASGGMADVFLARDNLLDRNVVIKRIRPDVEQDPAFVGMFMDEARTIAQLNHPHVVRIYDIGFDGRLPFMAMEWLNGWDLRTIMRHLRRRKETLDLGVAVQLIIDACRGLHAAHVARTEDGIPLRLVHRDVSPQNLFVTTDGVVKLLDFGIAKTAIQRNLTREGELKGKFAYMPPEQFEGGPIDKRADVFSLGVILHELITGRGLFGHLDPHQCYRAITHEPMPVPEREGARLPEGLQQIVLHALHRHAKARFQSAEELADALEDVALRYGLRRSTKEIASYFADILSKSRSPRNRARDWNTVPAQAPATANLSDAKEPSLSLSRSQGPMLSSCSDLRSVPPELLLRAEGPAGTRPRLPMRTKAARPRTTGWQPRKSAWGWILFSVAMVAAVAIWHAAPQTKQWGRDRVSAAVSRRCGRSGACASPVVRVAPGADARSALRGGGRGRAPDEPTSTAWDPDAVRPLAAAVGAMALSSASRHAETHSVGGPDAAGKTGPSIRGGRVLRNTPRSRHVRMALRWSKVRGAETYHVQVSRSPDFSDLAVDLEVGKTYVRKRRVPASDVYFCRTRAKSEGHYGPYGDVFELKPGDRHARRDRLRTRRLRAQGVIAAGEND